MTKEATIWITINIVSDNDFEGEGKLPVQIPIEALSEVVDHENTAVSNTFWAAVKTATKEYNERNS